MSAASRVNDGGWSLATSRRAFAVVLVVLCVMILWIGGWIFRTVLNEWGDPSGSPYLVLAGNFEGRWTLSEHSREMHPDLVVGHERLEIRVTEPIDMYDPAHPIHSEALGMATDS